MELIGVGILIAIGFYVAPYIVLLGLAVIGGIIGIITYPFRRD